MARRWLSVLLIEAAGGKEYEDGLMVQVYFWRNLEIDEHAGKQIGMEQRRIVASHGNVQEMVRGSTRVLEDCFSQQNLYL